MNLPLVDQIAKAVLYEGYLLYPYRRSAIKNRQRWNFGVLYPDSYEEVRLGSEKCSMRVECLFVGSELSKLMVETRFLQINTRSCIFSASQGSPSEPWQEASERKVSLPQKTASDLFETFSMPFELGAELKPTLDRSSSGDEDLVVRQQDALSGSLELKVVLTGKNLMKVSVVVRNSTQLANPKLMRDEALLRSMVSTHVVLQLENGSFISLLEPPEELRDQVARCQNSSAWPVLVGDREQRDTMLASPIILYDYPQIAPESAGDLFDGTEIDEILSLRIMTLTDQEKQEIRNSDDRARQILERTDAMPLEQFQKLHGVVRGMRPINEDQR